MKKSIRKKLNSRQGFSLAEMLVTVIILVLATAIVASGIPAAMNTYKKITAKSNAELLLSTTLTEFRTEFCTADGIEINSTSKAISYSDSATGNVSKIYNGDDGLMVQRYIDSDSPDEAHLLVTTQAASMILKLKYADASYSNGLLTISDIGVYEGTNKLVGIDEYIIRTAK